MASAPTSKKISVAIAAAKAKILPTATLKGNAVGVADQQVGIARRRGGADTVRATVGQQLNQHEVIKVKGETGDHQRRERLDQQPGR